MKISLHGSWLYLVDLLNQGFEQKWFEFENFKQNIDINEVNLPKCWNNIVENGESKYDRYEGVMWFSKEFEIENIDENCDYYLHFNGVNYLSRVWLNGTFLGMNEGGFLPFKFKISDYIKKDLNNLIVQVDSTRKSDGIPGKGTDWYNWGGIYRDIYIEFLPKARIYQVKIKTTKIERDKVNIELSFELTNPFRSSWEIFYNDNIVTKGQIRGTILKGVTKIEVLKPKLWDPQHPHLYTLKIFNDKKECIYNTKFGIRLIEIKNGHLFLNKKIADLRGINLHEELLPFARTIPIEERKKDLIMMKKLGFNALRTAHYPHDESLIKLADELGIYILEEIPIYWRIQFKNPKILILATKMIHFLIERDYNHPSVIMWSLGNEIPVENKYCKHVLTYLYQLARKQDDSRIITHVSNRIWGDPLRKLSDVVCLNIYFGWYYWSEKIINFVLELIKPTARNKPFFITEFGADAKLGFHSASIEKYSEEKQASLIAYSIEAFNSKDYIQGHFIWIYRDFRSPLRTNKYQKGFNRKGILSEKNEPKIIAKVYSKIKDKKRKGRKFVFLALIIKFVSNYLEQAINNFFLERILDYFIIKKTKRHYENFKRKMENQ